MTRLADCDHRLLWSQRVYHRETDQVRLHIWCDAGCGFDWVEVRDEEKDPAVSPLEWLESLGGGAGL